MPTKTMDTFYIAGLSARTTNANEAEGKGKIPIIWGQLMQNMPPELTARKTGEAIYAVYTDYESNHTGGYTFVLGVRVDLLDNLPPGITGVEISAGTYQCLTTEPGPAYQVVPSLWANIWSTPKLESIRSYKTDFELYDHRSKDPNNVIVDIYIGVES